MSRLTHWVVSTLLAYFSGSAPLPAPQNWQAFEGREFTLHLPPGWREIQAAEGARIKEEEGWDHAYQLAAYPLWDAPIVTVSTSTIKGGDPSSTGVARLGDLARTFRSSILASAKKAGSDTRSLIDPMVFDTERHRYWCRYVTLVKGRPEWLDLSATILTAHGALEIQATTEPSDAAVEEWFPIVVNSFEVRRGFEFREPLPGKTPSIGHFWGNLQKLSASTQLTSSEKLIRLTALVVSVPLVVGSVAFLLVLVLDLTIFSGRLKMAALRWLETSWIGRLGKGRSSAVPREARLRRIPLPWSFAAQFLLAWVTAYWVVPRYLHAPGLCGSCMSVLFNTAGYLLLFLAGSLHYLANNRRQLKYEILLISLTLLSVPGVAFDPVSQRLAVGQMPSYIAGMYLGNFLSQTIYFGLGGFIAFRLLRNAASSSRRVAGFYRWTHKQQPLPALLVLFAPSFPAGGFFGAAFLYLVARYSAGEKALESPVLYLRSFHDRNTSFVLAKIVMPAASRLGPVQAVAHVSQPAEELNRRTNALTAVRPVVLPSGSWQDWIRTVLPFCRAVLLDASVGTEGLLWELEQARKVLPESKILVLALESAPVGDIGGATLIRYRLDWRGRRAARKALRSWVKRLWRSNDSLAAIA
ncbi:MAG TPA: hypothetical protein VGS22_22845 [Thermoanaerobaculia bacterium]|jgi:hypothetical protein|nr:hypothetical protein [Thermoanaerobaculia bacterium]